MGNIKSIRIRISEDDDMPKTAADYQKLISQNKNSVDNKSLVLPHTIRQEKSEKAVTPAASLNPVKITEHKIQAHFFSVIKSYENVFPEFKAIYSVPNGASTWKTKDANGNWYSPAAQRLKAEGLRNGVPDICCPYSNDNYSSLYIEMKSLDGKLTTDQKNMIRLMHELGCKVIVSFCFEEAWRVLKEYTLERYQSRKYRRLDLAIKLKEINL
jgi:hypothetical protein